MIIISTTNTNNIFFKGKSNLAKAYPVSEHEKIVPSVLKIVIVAVNGKAFLKFKCLSASPNASNEICSGIQIASGFTASAGLCNEVLSI